MNVTIGEPYVDAGVTAIDYDDGDITSQIMVGNTVNVSISGTYKVSYSVTDKDGNTTVAARIVTVNEIH